MVHLDLESDFRAFLMFLLLLGLAFRIWQAKSAPINLCASAFDLEQLFIQAKIKALHNSTLL